MQATPEEKYKVFDDALTDLLVTLEKVIEIHEKHNLSLTDTVNPIKVRLESYINTYDKTSPEDHIWSFNNLYNKHKNAIMKGPGKDNWLRTGKIVIQFGEDVGIKNNIKIHLSSIYNTAFKLRQEVEESLDGLPDVEQSEEILLPITIQYYLYKIFSEIIIKKTDKRKLKNFASDLAIDAGIKSYSRPSNNPLDGLMSTMTGLAKQMGVDVPEDQKMPSGDELSKIMGNMMNNPQTKNLLGNVMKEMKDCNNIGDIAGKLMGALGGAAQNPEISSLVENVGQAIGEHSNDNSNDNSNNAADQE